MEAATQIQQIEQLLDSVLSTDTQYFKVFLKIKPTNNIKVFIDGDNGLAVEKCVSFNRKLYKLIEEAGMYPEGDFSLEVSSPGVDEPLRILRQYHRNIGRNVEVILSDDMKHEGRLIEVREGEIVLEYTEGKGKKAVTQQLIIPFDNIKSTTVQIQF